MAKNPKFTVLYEKLRGQSFEIDQETMSIGRKEGSDIRLVDGSVSGHHADIIRTTVDGSVCYILRDNDSTNGTKVNNEDITEKVLKNSDLIVFGNVEVLFDSGNFAVPDGENLPTHTIDLSSIESNTATTQTLINFNPLADTEKKKHALVTKLTIAFLVVLGAIALFWVYKIFSA